MKLPTSALFRGGDHWAVYVASDGVAHKRALVLSRRSGLGAVVIEEGQCLRKVGTILAAAAGAIFERMPLVDPRR